MYGCPEMKGWMLLYWSRGWKIKTWKRVEDGTFKNPLLRKLVWILGVSCSDEKVRTVVDCNDEPLPPLFVFTQLADRHPGPDKPSVWPPAEEWDDLVPALLLGVKQGEFVRGLTSELRLSRRLGGSLTTKSLINKLYSDVMLARVRSEKRSYSTSLVSPLTADYLKLLNQDSWKKIFFFFFPSN